MDQGAVIHEASLGRIRLKLTAVCAGSDLLILLTGGRAHIGAIAMATPAGLAGVTECKGHREGALAAELAVRIACQLGSRVAIACGIHYDNITAGEIENALELARQLAGKLLANAGDTEMLSLADIHQLEQHMKSGELEKEFRQGPEEKRLEILEMLEGLMNAADIADEVATRLIFRGGPSDRIPPS